MSSLICVLFRSVLFSLQGFRDFPAIFLLLISSLIPLWSDTDIVCFPFFYIH